MTTQVNIEIPHGQPHAVRIETVSFEGRTIAHREVTPGSGLQIFHLHSGNSLRVAEGRSVPAMPPPAPKPAGLDQSEGGE